MNKPTQYKQLIKQRLNHLQAGSIVILLIGITTILYYGYMVFPRTAIWETPYFIYQSQYYQDVHTFVWTLLQKLIPLSLLIIWYMTCRHWWAGAIMIPITTIIVQIIILFNDDLQYFDEVDGLFTVPFLIITLLLLYKIRKKVKYYTQVLNLGDQIQQIKQHHGV